jgi:hypothetical protein
MKLGLLSILLSLIIFQSHAQSAALMATINHPSDTPTYYRLIEYVSTKHITGDSTFETNIANDLLKWAEVHNDIQIKIEAIHWKSFNEWRDFNKHVAIRNEAIQLAIQHESPIQEANGYHFLANDYWGKGKNILAYENFLKAFEKYEQVGYHTVPAMRCRAFDYAKFLYAMQEYKGALKMMYIAQYYQNPIDFYFKMHVPNTIALCHRKLGNYQLSIFYNKKAIDVASKDSNWVWVGILSGNLGNDLIALKKYELALTYLKTSVAWAIKHKMYDNQVEGQTRLAECYMNLGKSDLAYKALNDIANLLDQYGSLPTKVNYHLQLTHYYKLKNDKSSELFSSKQYQLLKDSAFNQTFSVQYTNDRVKLEAERNVEKIKRIDNDKKVAEFVRNLLIIVMLFLAFAGAGFYNYKRLKYKQQQTVLKLENEKLEQEKLAKEKALQDAELKLQEFTQNILEKNHLIEQIQLELSHNKTGVKSEVPPQDIEKINQLSKLTLLTEKDWDSFKQLFESAFPTYLTSVQLNYPQITNAETRFLCLSKLNLPVKDMANMLAISPSSLRQIKYRLRDKLRFSGKDINDLLLKELV